VLLLSFGGFRVGYMRLGMGCLPQLNPFMVMSNLGELFTRDRESRRIYSLRLLMSGWCAVDLGLGVAAQAGLENLR